MRPMIAGLGGLFLFAASMTMNTTSTASDDEWRLTYYDLPGNVMACDGAVFHSDDPTIVASPVGGFPCGTRLEVCTSVCRTLTVQDRCPGCGSRHLDLGIAAYRLLGSQDWGTVRVAGAAPPSRSDAGTVAGGSIHLPESGSGGYLEP